MHPQRRSLEFPADSLLSVLLAECLPCGDSCEGQQDTRIRHYSVRPAFFSGTLQQVEILLRHFHIHLNGSLHASCIGQSPVFGNVTNGTKSTRTVSFLGSSNPSRFARMKAS